jgi:hypothetical protein
MSRLTLTILAAAGITLFTGVWFLVHTSALADENAQATAGTELTQAYSDPTYGFSFRYPADLSLTVEAITSIGHIVFGEQPDGTTALMIVAASYPLDATLTEEDIRSANDLSSLDGAIERTTIAGGIPAFSLRLRSGPLGDTHALLFAYRGIFYQLLLAAHRESDLSVIPATLRLQE